MAKGLHGFSLLNALCVAFRPGFTYWFRLKILVAKLY